MKLSILGKDLPVTLWKWEGKIKVVICGGAELTNSPLLLRQAVGTVVGDILVPLAGGSEVEFYARTQGGWFELMIKGNSSAPSGVRAMPMHAGNPRIEVLERGMHARKAYLDMKTWLTSKLAEPVL